MAERTVIVASTHGLHARPASLLVQVVAASGLEVSLTAGDRTINAGSILLLLSLGVDRGDAVTLTAVGEGAGTVLDALARIITTDHDA